jgi:hypothetical protein
LAASLAPRLEAMAQAGRAQVESLEEALEERELAVARLGRELEALRDTQAAGTAEVAQRELSRTEAERRAALVGEQRACWSTLQEVERGIRAAAMAQALATVAQAEAVGRQALSEAEAAGWGEALGSALQRLRALVPEVQAAQPAPDAVAAAAAAATVVAAAEEAATALQLRATELEQQLVQVQAEAAAQQQELRVQLERVSQQAAACRQLEEEEAAARLAVAAEHAAAVVGPAAQALPRHPQQWLAFHPFRRSGLLCNLSSE